MPFKFRIVAAMKQPMVTRIWLGEKGESVLYDTLAEVEEAIRLLRIGADPAVTFGAQQIEIS
jgi:hypothetical protein